MENIMRLINRATKQNDINLTLSGNQEPEKNKDFFHNIKN